jgi:hypothetical protein
VKDKFAFRGSCDKSEESRSFGSLRMTSLDGWTNFRGLRE